MRKHFIATCVLLLLLSGLSVGAKDGETKRRTVVLVYDDSGSMRASGNTTVNRWMYASYALQSFVGLLDQNDRFSYVPMSNPGQEVSLVLSKRQTEIDGIRNWNNYKNTPFQSVETAIESIKRQAVNSQTDEFWLMVLTDGAFNELESTNRTLYEENKKRITETLQHFKGWMDERKLSIHAVLITMESHLTEAERQQVATFKSIWQQTTNGILIPTDGEDGIVNSVNEAAALIANRDPFSKTEEIVKTTINGEKATVNSPFPLRRITIVQQGEASPARVTVKQLQVEGPYQTQTPQQNLLSGSITHITTIDSAVLRAGTYEISFDRTVSSKDTKILVEPALDYRVQLYESNGMKIEGNDSVYADSVVTVEAKPNEIPVDPSYFHASLINEGKVETMKWDATRKAFVTKLKVGSEGIHGQIRMNIKGFYEQTKEWQISVKAKPVLSLQVRTKNWQADVTKLLESNPLVVTPLVNGKPMMKEEWDDATFRITNEERVRYTIRKGDGELYVYPQPYYSNLFNFTKTGTVHATVTMKSPLGETSQSLALYIRDVSFWQRYNVIFQYVLPVVIGAIVLAFIVIGWIIRPRFARTAFVMYEMDQSFAAEWIHKGEPELLRNAWWKHYFGIPYRAERRTVQSVTFIAKKGTKAVLIAKESQVEGMMIDGSLLQREEIGMEHRTLYPNEIVKIERGYGKETYRYECD